MNSKSDLSTGEPDAKRRRIAYEASAQCITNTLPEEVLRNIFGTFLGPGHYRYVAGTCRVFWHAYKSAMPEQHNHKTFYRSAAASVPCAALCLRESHSIRQIALEAARGGQIDVIVWAKNRGCECDYRLFYEAARSGQLEVFEWADTNGLEWVLSGAAAGAASAGHVRLLEWMREHNVQRWPFEHCAFNAAEGGHVSVLEWLKKHGITIHVKACWYRAAENGRVNVLDWLLDHRESLYHFVMDLAAKAGQICVLKWAQQHEVGWSDRTCALAAFGGHLKALKWLRENGCPWDGNVIYWAQENGHSDVVEWARNNGCPSGAYWMYSRTELL